MNARAAVVALLVAAVPATAAGEDETPELLHQVDAQIELTEQYHTDVKAKLDLAENRLAELRAQLQLQKAEADKLRDKFDGYLHRKQLTEALGSVGKVFGGYVDCWKQRAWSPLELVSEEYGKQTRWALAVASGMEQLRREDEAYAGLGDQGGEPQRGNYRTLWEWLVIQIDCADVQEKADALRAAERAYRVERDRVDEDIRNDASLRQHWGECRSLSELGALVAKAPLTYRQTEEQIRLLENATIPWLRKRLAALAQDTRDLKVCRTNVARNMPPRPPATRAATVPPPSRTTAPAPPKPKVVWKVIEAEPSELQGSFGKRYHVWRLRIQVEVTNHVPVTLRFAQRALAPETQLPVTDLRAMRWPDASEARYRNRVKQGELIELLEERVSLAYEEMRPGPTAVEFYDYLTVWEPNGFRGQYKARLEFTGASRNLSPLEITWKPQPQTPFRGDPRIVVISPTPDRLKKTSDASVWFRVLVKEQVAPGVHRLRVEFTRPARPRPYYLYAKLHKPGQPDFKGRLAIPNGPFSIVFSLPELEGFGCGRLEGTCARPWSDSEREQLKRNQAGIRQVAGELQDPALPPSSARSKRSAMAYSYATRARLLNEHGQFAEAKDAAYSALKMLKAAGGDLSDSYWRGARKNVLAQLRAPKRTHS
jgi:hypothetical protein